MIQGMGQGFGGVLKWGCSAEAGRRTEARREQLLQRGRGAPDLLGRNRSVAPRLLLLLL